MSRLNYTGHAIVVTDELSSIAFTGPGDGTTFETDEQAVTWAAKMFRIGVWHYASLTDGTAAR